MVDRVSAAAKPSEKQLVAYAVRVATPEAVAEVVRTLVPDAQIVVEPKTQQIVAYGTNEDHALISTTVRQMDRELPAGAQYELRTHAVRGINPTMLNTMLAQQLPDVQVVADPAAGTVAAWARAEDHEKIDEVIDRLTPAADPERDPRIQVYDTDDADQDSLLTVVTQLAPTARASIDRANRKLLVWAQPRDLEAIGRVVQEVVESEGQSSDRQITVYRVDPNRYSAIVTSLAAAVPATRATLADKDAANVA